MPFLFGLICLLGLIHLSSQSDNKLKLFSLATDWESAQNNCINDTRILMPEMPSVIPLTNITSGEVIWVNAKVTWIEYPNGHMEYVKFAYMPSEEFLENCICFFNKDSVSKCVCLQRLEDGSFIERLDNCSNSHSYVCAKDPDKFAPTLHRIESLTKYENIGGPSTTSEFTKYIYQGSDDSKGSTTVNWLVSGGIGIGIAGCIVGTVGVVYVCRRGHCLRLSRHSLKQFRNGQTILSMEPVPSVFDGQPLSSVGVSHDPTQDYLHVVGDKYDEQTFESTMEVNRMFQSTDDNLVYHEIDPDNIVERQVTPKYQSLQMRETHLYDGLLESSSISPESSYVIGRIAESEAQVEKHFAVAK